MERLSVVISAYERTELLGRVLDRLDRQTTDAFEVVVAINRAQPELAPFEAVAAGRARIVQSQGRIGVSASRNAGWRAAREPVVLFLGDDMLPAADLVERHLAFHRAQPEPEAALLGHVRWAPELRRTAFMEWLESGVQFDFGSIRGTQAAWWHLYASNASLKRALLERVGGYDEAFEFGYEDLDLGIRADAAGLRLTYDRDAVVDHVHPTTLASYRERMRIVAAAEKQFVAKHPQAVAYFHERFTRAVAQPPASRRGARLARLVPRGLPVLGPRVHFSADRYFNQQLAGPFLEAWDQ